MKFSLVICLLVLLGVATLTGADEKEKETRFWGKLGKFFTKIVNLADKGIDKADDVMDKVIDFVTDTAEDAVDGFQDGFNFTTKVAKKVGKGVAKISKKLGKGVASISKKAFRTIYDEAKKDFKAISKVAEKIDFDQVVDDMIDLIDSAPSNLLCSFGCRTGAVALLGPEMAPMTITACPLVCKAALAKLEDFAEFVADEVADG